MLQVQICENDFVIVQVCRCDLTASQLPFSSSPSLSLNFYFFSLSLIPFPLSLPFYFPPLSLLSPSTPSLFLSAAPILTVQFVSRKVRAVTSRLRRPEIMQILIATTTMMYYLAMRSFLYIETLISDLSVFTSDGITANLLTLQQQFVIIQSTII